MKRSEVILSKEDAWRIYELLEQMNDFLHQPDNYRDQPDVVNWLKSGVYVELKEVFYGMVAKWFEVDDESGRVLPPSGVERKFPNS
jgi:hypothetical protein